MKYFCVSDIHSFGNILIDTLDKVGFDKNNKEHCIIFLGDIFDRGDETIEVYKFIQSIPKNQRILIRGNHELLYLELLKKQFPEKHDFSNGTIKTFCHIADIDPNKLDRYYWCIEAAASNLSQVEQTAYIKNKLCETWTQVKSAVSKSKITKFLKSKEWKNYFELDKYILVHSFIPVKLKSEFNFMYNYYPTSQVPAGCLEYNPDWRTVKDYEWEDATWGCPFEQFRAGLFDEEANNEKILVVGHWHTSAFFKAFDENVINIDECPIFRGDLLGKADLIAIDACTAATKRMNILVLEV